MNLLERIFAIPPVDVVPARSARSAVLIRELTSADRHQLFQHLASLDNDDRLLRFGQVVSDAIIEGYVSGIDFSRDTVFGVFDDNLHLIGAAHVAMLPENGSERVAEFGVSVLAQARGQGIGSRLFERTAMHCRNKHVKTLYMHCLSRNATMMHIAKKAGMDINYAYGEADAYLTLPPADTATVVDEILQEQAATFDYAVKRQVHDTRQLLAAWLPQLKVA